MANEVVTDSHIRGLANRAEIAPVRTGLIFRRQQDGKARLRESAPRVVHDVALNQNALCVFQFEEIFDDEWIPVGCTHVPDLPFHPNQRFEEVILTDLNIRGCGCCGASAEYDVFAGSL